MESPLMSCCTLDSALESDETSVAVVCHDAGAANLIAHWICEKTALRLQFCMKGPAREIWLRRFPHCSTVSFDDALRRARIVISGTGWSSNLEHEARKSARSARVKSIAVLDHWINYRARFEREGELVLPTEVWVADTWAFAKAQQALPEVPVRMFPNQYLNHLVSEVRACQMSSPKSPETVQALYVCEPLRAEWCRGRPNPEFECLDLFDRFAWRISSGRKVHLTIRPHPSENSCKYAAWSPRHIDSWKIDAQASLAAQIAESEIVVGCESFAMTIALASGRTVFSSLPTAAPRCRLPQPQIRMLRDLEDA